MDVNFEKCEVKGDIVEVVGKFVMSLADIKERLKHGNYANGSLGTGIMAEIVGRIAQEYLAEHKTEIMEGVDLDKIIKGVQLKVVEGFSLNAQSRM